MVYKKFVLIVLGVVLLGIIIAAGTVVYVDPFFHYHKPRPEFFYTLKNARYQNYGIIKHFEYDSIITGTSMTQNFKTTEFDDLFKANSIKVAFAGARFKEINDALEVSYKAGKKVKYIVRSLDLYNIALDKDAARDDLGKYPTYLYNDNIFDDVKYVLNEDALFRYSFKSILGKIRGKKGGVSGFDEYSNWNDNFKFGKEYVLKGTKPYAKAGNQSGLSENDIKIAEENIKVNLVSLAKNHPETTFYLFFPPYSIVYWAMQDTDGELLRSLDAEELAIRMLLQQPNIKLFSFNLMTDITANLNNYRDTTHYGESVNSKIFKYMRNDIGLLTTENFKDYITRERELYINYPYEKIWE